MIAEEWYCPTIRVGWYIPLGHSHIVSGPKSGFTHILLLPVEDNPSGEWPQKTSLQMFSHYTL